MIINVYLYYDLHFAFYLHFYNNWWGVPPLQDERERPRWRSFETFNISFFYDFDLFAPPTVIANHVNAIIM